MVVVVVVITSEKMLFIIKYKQELGMDGLLRLRQDNTIIAEYFARK